MSESYSVESEVFFGYGTPEPADMTPAEWAEYDAWIAEDMEKWDARAKADFDDWIADR